MPKVIYVDQATGRFLRDKTYHDVKPAPKVGEIEADSSRPAEDQIWNDSTKAWEFNQALRDELDGIEQTRQRNRLLMRAARLFYEATEQLIAGGQVNESALSQQSKNTLQAIRNLP